MSYSHDDNDEVLYTQEDLDKVLEKLSEAKREAELSHQLVWIIVQSAGGHVKVRHSLWIGEPDRELVMWDNPITHELNLKIEQAQDV